MTSEEARDTGSNGSPKTPAKTRRKPRATASAVPPPDLQLTGDRLVVHNPENGERKTAGGLLIPATAAPAPKRLSWGDVTLVGPDVRVAKRGDRVLYLPSSGLEVELEGTDYVLLRERDVQAVTAAEAGGNAPGTGQYL